MMTFLFIDFRGVIVGPRHAVGMAFLGLILFGTFWVISSILVFLILMLFYAATLILVLEIKWQK